MKKENRNWIILIIGLICVILFLGILRAIILAQKYGYKLSFLLESFMVFVFGLILLVFIGIIPVVILIGLSFITLHFFHLKLKRKKLIRIVLLICIIFGLFFIPNIYPLIDQISNLTNKIYPSIVIGLIENSQPDDFITPTLALSTYGAIVGLVVGIILSIIILKIKK